jgi:hypothetical protein
MPEVLDPRQVKGLHSGVCPGNVLGVLAVGSAAALCLYKAFTRCLGNTILLRSMAAQEARNADCRILHEKGN